MKTLRLSLMMFVQFLMLPVWLVPLLPYVGRLAGGADWLFAFGLLMGIGTFSSPLVGMFADRFLNAERVLALCNALTAVLLWAAFLTESPATLFCVLLATMLVHMPTWAVSSSIALVHVPAARFATIRVFGTVGWVASGGFSLLGTKLLGVEGFDASRWIFAAGALAAAFGAGLALTLPATPPRAKGKPMCVSDALGLGAFRLFREPRFAAFGVLITLAMVPFNWYVSYNALYLAESGFGYLTLTQNLGQVGEIGFMLLVPVIMRRMGCRRAFMLGAGAVALRYLCFSAAAAWGFSAGNFIGILIHGLAFGILVVGAQMYADESAPAELRHQAQGLVMLLTNGVGLFLSNLVFDRILAHSLLSADPLRHRWIVPFLTALAMSCVLVGLMAVFLRPDGPPPDRR